MQFKDWEVDWILKPRAKGISVQVRPFRALKVTSPKSCRWSDVQKFLSVHEAWIRKQLDRFRQYELQYPPKKLKSEEKYLFLGQELKLRYLPTPLKTVFFSRTESELRLHLPELIFSSIEAEELDQYLPILKKFYRKEAQKFLEERIKLWSHEMGLQFQKLSFRNQKTRWGSCNSKGHISLNWKLIATPLFVLDSVLIHELAHLRHMNHSPAFWNLVAEFCPEYDQADKWLHDHFGALEWLSV